MRRAIILLVCWLAAWGAAGATTHTVATAAALQNCLNNSCPAGASLNCGDTINVAAGTYNSDAFTFSGKNCCPGGVCNYITLQPTPGAAVFLEGTVPASWTSCSDGAGGCIGTCTGVPVGQCVNTYFTTGSGMTGAKTAQGTTTYSVGSLSQLTNSHTVDAPPYPAFNNKVCATETWHSCFVNTDCPNQDCTATQPERDSYAASAAGPFFINMGSPTPPSGNVMYNTGGSCNCNGFKITNVQGLIIQNFVSRHRRHAAIAVTNSGCSDIFLINNRSFYIKDDQGSDYSMAVYNATNVTLDGNEVAFAGSEIHTEGNTGDAPTVLFIKNNWVHHIGEARVLGPYFSYGASGTPDGFIFGENGGGPGTGNYTGSEFYGNLVENILDNGVTSNNSGIGIILENDSDGWKIYNNIFRNIGAEGIKCSATGSNPLASCSNNSIYGNLFIATGQLPKNGSGSSILFTSGSKPVTGNKVFNNTFINSGFSAPGSASIKSESGCNSGQCTNNVFRNNIIFDNQAWSPGRRLINWAAAGMPSGNSFQNNLLFANGTTTSSIVASIGGSPFTVANWTLGGDVDGDASSDTNKYGDPGFTLEDCSLNDYRLHPFNQANQTNPALDAGTMTGMPARTGIHNTIASAHGLANYTRLQTTNISALPDIGAWETLLQDPGFESGSIDAPWNVPLGAPQICPFYPVSVATGAIGGLKAMNLTTGPCLESICSSNCRKMIVQQAFTGLEVGRTYSLEGSWKIVSGAPTSTAFVAFVSCTGAECALDPFNSDPPSCSVLIGGDSSVGFNCPSFMIPSASSMTIAIIPSINAGVVVAIDNLELR